MRIDIEGVTVTIDARDIVSSVNLTVEPGELIGLVGPNGSGKSTLLRTIYRVLKPARGAVRIGGDDVWRLTARESARRRAIVTQHTVHDADFSVQEIVAMGRTSRKGMLERDTTRDQEIVERALDDVHMTWARDRAYATLSGGEQQRILIARALAQEAGIFILDEPTNHLDALAQFEVLEMLRRLGRTALTALHDLNHAASYCDRIAVMRDGHLEAVGTPKDVLTPDLIYDVFGVRAAIITHPITDKPHIALASAQQHSPIRSANTSRLNPDSHS